MPQTPKEFAVSLRMEPVREPFASVYRRRGMDVPELASRHPLAAAWPYHYRSLHRAYAHRFGYYWLPCVLCGREYGGHEITGSIPDPTDEAGHMWQTICPACTSERNGGEA